VDEQKQTIFFNAAAYSLDAGDRIYSAIVLTGDKITYVGDEAGARAIAPHAELIDLGGEVEIYPGFVDAHAHVYGTGERVLKPRLEGLDSIEAIVEKLRLLVGLKPGNWIIARGWDQNLWNDARLPTATDLESLGDTNPIALTRIDGHALWCNHLALQLSNIDSSTPDPQGGSILKSSSVEPTGILLDEAMKLVENNLPPTEKNLQLGILRTGMAKFAHHGNVAVHDMGVNAELWDALHTLYQTEGSSLPRCWLFLDMNTATGKARFLEMMDSSKPYKEVYPRLHFAGIKIYLDGALGSRGANLFEEYSDNPGNRGLRLSDDAEVLRLMELAASKNLQIAVHAIGDAANARALDLFEQLQNRSGVLRIEHAQIVRGSDLERYRKLGVYALIQPPFFKSDRKWAVERLGASRMRTAYRWKSFVDAGVSIVAGSDSPVEAPDTLEGIELLQSRDGIKDNEGVSKMAAVRAYAQNVYRITGEENLCGSIEIGRRADLTFVEKSNKTGVPCIIGTMVDGSWIYCAESRREFLTTEPQSVGNAKTYRP
jgi:predicted amidohydrolase YtcJ